MQLKVHEGRPPVRGTVRRRLTFGSSVDEKQHAVACLMESLRALGIDKEPELFRHRLCLDEAIQNAIQHGNSGDVDKLVEATLFESEDCWEVVISDQGEGFDPAGVPDPTTPEFLMQESGRGLWILNEYMDHVEFCHGGRTVYLYKRKM